ncbi:MAG: class I SAM-dependent methyltransferase [Terrimicrobiaceae bacterium]
MTELNTTQNAAKAQFESRSASYGKTHILADVSDVARILEGLSWPVGTQALDVATGGGHTAVYLASRGLRVIGSDISPAMTRNAVQLAAERGLTVEGRVHIAEELPYPDETFGLVTCRVAAHHFSDPSAFVKESWRVLARGGWFLLIDGSVPDREPEAREWIHRVEKLRDPSHAAFLAPADWEKLARDAGFVIQNRGLTPFKQPDLEWYFETAATSPQNREAVRELVRNAPESAKRVFQLAEEDGRTVWWWPRFAMLAQKSPKAL